MIRLMILTIMTLLFFSSCSKKNLVAYFPFENEKASDQINDENGQIYGNLKSVEGIKGKAFHFDGGNNKIIFKGKVNQYLQGKNDFSISFYLQNNFSTESTSLIGKRPKCNGYKMFDLRLKNNRMSAELYERQHPNIRATTGIDIPDSKWHHYVYVKSGNTVQLFQDGVLAGSDQSSQVIEINDTSFLSINNSPCIGVDGTRNLNASIDELKIFNIALSESEIVQLFKKHNLPK